MKKRQDATFFSFFPSAATARMAVANVRMSYWLRHPSTSPIEKRALSNVRSELPAAKSLAETYLIFRETPILCESPSSR